VEGPPEGGLGQSHKKGVIPHLGQFGALNICSCVGGFFAFDTTLFFMGGTAFRRILKIEKSEVKEVYSLHL
jgi:hypothetical protein